MKLVLLKIQTRRVNCKISCKKYGDVLRNKRSSLGRKIKVNVFCVVVFEEKDEGFVPSSK